MYSCVSKTYISCVLVQRRQQQLQFRPPLEEIRAKYYRELKKFVCIPNHFRGVGDSAKPMTTIFPRMIDRNPTGFSTVYRKVRNNNIILKFMVATLNYRLC